MAVVDNMEVAANNMEEVAPGQVQVKVKAIMIMDTVEEMATVVVTIIMSTTMDMVVVMVEVMVPDQKMTFQI